MTLLLAILLVAIALGYALGGRLRNLEGLRLRWWGLAPIGLAMQLLPVPFSGRTDHLVSVALLIASYGVLLLFILMNVRLPGSILILVGLAMNLTVISANAGMPVSEHAVKASGQGNLLRDLTRHGGAKHHLAGPGDVLLQLADEIPIGPPIRQVASAGDVVVYAGVMWLIAATMRGRRRGVFARRRHRPGARRRRTLREPREERSGVPPVGPPPPTTSGTAP